MGTGVSLFFIAVGAILTFAVETNTEGFDLDTTGMILMVIGLLGLLWSLIAWDDWRPFGGRDYDDDVVVRRNYVDDDVAVRRNYVDVGDDAVGRRKAILVDDELPARRTVRRVYR